MEALKAPLPAVRVVYKGKDITRDLAPYSMEATYTDRLTGQADELELSLADIDGRWKNDWYPDKGDDIQFEYGWEGSKLVSAGAFEVDEVELTGPPDTIRIRAQAVGLSRQARTRIGKAYENTTFKAIVEKVAKRLKAAVIGTIADIKIPKATQYGETDWAFLVRLAREYGYVVKLTDNNKKLVVTKLTGLAAGGVVRALRPGDFSSYTFRDKVTEVPAKTEVRSHDPDKKRLVKGDGQAGGLAKGKTSSDTRRRVVQAKTPAQAKAIADADQERHEIDKTSLSGSLPGDPKLVAGAAVALVDFGKLNGEYLITEARHALGGGYGCEIQLKRTKEP